MTREMELVLLAAYRAKDRRAAFFTLVDPQAALALDGPEFGLFLDLMWGPLGLDFGDALLLLARAYQVPPSWVLRAELSLNEPGDRGRLLADAMKNRHFAEAVS